MEVLNPLCADGLHASGCLGAVKVSPFPGEYGHCSCTPRAEPPPDRRPLCPDCRAAADAWRDARMPPPPIRLISIGDSNVRNVADRRRARADDHYALIRRQRAMIAERCRRLHI